MSTAPRPAYCCGNCPPIEGGGYDCTCRGNPRCTTNLPAEAVEAAADAVCPSPGNHFPLADGFDWHERECVAIARAALAAALPHLAVVPDRDTIAREVADFLAPFDTVMNVKAEAVGVADAVLAVLPGRPVAEIKAEALREAAREIDWEWEVFTANDGVRSIRQHSKGPTELLHVRAARIEAGEQP